MRFYGYNKLFDVLNSLIMLTQLICGNEYSLNQLLHINEFESSSNFLAAAVGPTVRLIKEFTVDVSE